MAQQESAPVQLYYCRGDLLLEQPSTTTEQKEIEDFRALLQKPLQPHCTSIITKPNIMQVSWQNYHICSNY